MSFGELVFSAVRRQKVKTMKTNHSIVQGCIPKKAAGERPCKGSNTSYLARFSKFVS